MSVEEILGFITGAACVWLAVRQNVWTFPVGLANNVVFLVLFTGTGLYANAGLQVVYHMALSVFDNRLTVIRAHHHDGDVDARLRRDLAHGLVPVVIVVTREAGRHLRFLDDVEALVLAEHMIETRPHAVAERVAEHDDVVAFALHGRGDNLGRR